jgi:APA family basic amino acid/polyamine antiporter
MMVQSAPTQIIIGTSLIIIGIPIYIFYAPKTEIETVKKDIAECIGFCEMCARSCAMRMPRQEVFLAHLIKHVRDLIKRI